MPRFKECIVNLCTHYADWETDIDINITALSYKVRIWTSNGELMTMLVLQYPEMNIEPYEAIELITKHGERYEFDQL